MSLPRINHTQISNAFIDKWLPVCTPGEVKVFLIIARHTIGWHRETADLSLSRIEALSGLSRRTVYTMTESLAEKGLITKTAGNPMTKYSINYDIVEDVDKNVDNCEGGERNTPEKEPGGVKVTPETSPAGVNLAPKSAFTGVKLAPIERKGKEKEKRNPSSTSAIQKIFREAGSEYYHDGREAKATAELSDRYEMDPERFKSVVFALVRLRLEDKFYKKMPLSPSTLKTFWNVAVEKANEIAAKKSPAQEETRMANGMTTKEYMAQVEKEKQERGELQSEGRR